MNTRRFPRTLLEAFGCDARSAYAVERFRSSRAGDVALAVLIGTALAALLFFQLSK